MNRTAQRRLERLEKRQPKDPYAHMSDEDVERRVKELYAQQVEELGIDEFRASFGREFPEALRELDKLQAQGFFRDA